ncbi:uncharacterized protein LOC131944781 [Physella acuta]|uniref:uncharacterized protein LOC131944781 n=1 Tax=Physella acuta TaxID=109671 RepID=UPI0027DC9930|nr:uncharacterized protein LOC131944781 [Physella acuta]
MEEQGTLAPAIFVMGMGFLIHTIAMATPYWVQMGMANAGLWASCVLETCVAYVEKPDWMMACEAFSVVGTIFGAGALAFTTVNFCNDCFRRPQNARLAGFLLGSSILAFACIMTCIGIFAGYANYGSSLSFSFYMSSCGGVLMVMGGIMGYVIVRRCGY